MLGVDRMIVRTYTATVVFEEKSVSGCPRDSPSKLSGHASEEMTSLKIVGVVHAKGAAVAVSCPSSK